MKKVFLVILSALLILTSLSLFGNASNTASLCTGRYLGDANGDGKVTADDARFVLRYSVGLEKCASDEQLLYLNTSYDRAVNASDARLTLRISVGLDKAVKHEYKTVKIKSSTCTEKGYISSVCECCNESMYIDFSFAAHNPSEDNCTGIGYCKSCNVKLTVNIRHNFSEYRCLSCNAVDCIRVRNDISAFVKANGNSKDGKYVYSESNGSELYYLLYEPLKDELSVCAELFVDNNGSISSCVGEVSLTEDFEKPEISLKFISNNKTEASAVYVIDKKALSADKKAYDSLKQKKYDAHEGASAEIRRMAYDSAVSSVLWLNEILSCCKCPVDINDIGFVSV